MDKPLLNFVGWIAYLAGIVEILHVVQLVIIVVMTGGVGVPIFLLNLVSVLMGLLLMLAGYIFRQNLVQQMVWAAGASFGHWLLTILYFVLYSSQFISTIQFLEGYAFLDYVAYGSMVSGFSIGLGLTGLYQHFLPEDPDFISKTGRFRWVGLFFLLIFLMIGIVLAGNPATFIDLGALFVVVMPLPVLIWISGLRGYKLIEFFAGIISLSIVQEEHAEDFVTYASQAGWYILYLGIIGTIIGLVTLLKHLDEPSKIGPSVAVSLVCLFYGLLFKVFVFDPYARGLKNTIES